MQAKAAVESTFMRNPMGPVVEIVIASISETTKETEKADTGPHINPRITITISFGSYFKNSTLDMGILAKRVRM